MKFRSAVVVVLAAAAAGCTVTVDSHSEIVREERRFPVTGVADVRVATFDGSIKIQSWEKAEVLVEIEKRGPTKNAVEGVEIKVDQTGGIIDLDVRRPRSESFSGIGIHRTAYAHLSVWVPRQTNIRARSGDGAIQIDRVAGRIELRTGDGRITASEISGDLTLDTGDGSITVDGAEGQLTVDTGDGTVNVAGKLAAVKLHSGDGSIVYRAAPGSSMSSDWDITTGDGAVALYLPPDFGAEIDAHTGDGRITNDLDLEKVEREPRERERRSFKGRIGAGGPLLRIRTGDGAIRLKSN